MKINTVDTVIQDFREGQNIFRRSSVELMVREISRLQTRVQEFEVFNNILHTQCINALDLHRESDIPKLKDIPKIIENFRTRVQELEQERRWIPINEPPDRQDTRQKLLIDKNEEWSGLGVAEWNFGWCDQISRPDGEYRWVTCGNRPFTHWQHLPQPPKEVTNETTYLI